MGGYFSKWKASTPEQTLEKLQKDINYYEDRKKNSEESQKKALGSLVIYTVLIYVLSLPVIYMYYIPDDLGSRCALLSLMIGILVLIFLIRHAAKSYYGRRAQRSFQQLEKLKLQRTKILDEVMDTQTFNKAREILRKFDEDRYHQMQVSQTASPDSSPARGQRTAGTPAAYLKNPEPTAMNTPGQMYGTPGPVRLARPLLPRDPSTFERLINLIVGDGPQHRYALICSQCHSHNGMALEEEFEYVAFRCCYCLHMNAARKQRPTAPRLDMPAPNTPARFRHAQVEELPEQPDTPYRAVTQGVPTAQANATIYPDDETMDESAIIEELDLDRPGDLPGESLPQPEPTLEEKKTN